MHVDVWIEHYKDQLKLKLIINLTSGLFINNQQHNGKDVIQFSFCDASDDIVHTIKFLGLVMSICMNRLCDHWFLNYSIANP